MHHQYLPRYPRYTLPVENDPEKKVQRPKNNPQKKLEVLEKIEKYAKFFLSL